MALEREQARGGQAFYLHNRVESIDEVAAEARGAVSRPALPRRARPDVGEGARGAHARVPAPATRTSSSRRRSSSRASTSRRRTRSSSSAPTRSGSPSCTRSAAASGRSDVLAYAYLFYPDASELTPGGARSPRRRSPTTRSSARASRSRCAISRSAARATCSAPSSPATSPRSASSSTSRCSTRRSPSSRAAGAWPRGPVRVDARVDAFVPGVVRRRRGAQDRPPSPHRAGRGRGRAARARLGDRGSLRPAPGAGREPVRDPGGQAEARPPRRGLPRLPRRPCDRRAARARLRRGQGARRGRTDPRVLDAEARGVTARRLAQGLRSSCPMLSSRPAWPLRCGLSRGRPS